MSSNLIWKNKTLATFGDMIDAVTGCETKEEAQELMRLYRADCEHADHNIGYMTGYLDAPAAKRVMEWCGVKHPFFGSLDLTPKEAFEAGQAYAATASKANSVGTQEEGE
jgi:hypothetical protein